MEFNEVMFSSSGTELLETRNKKKKNHISAISHLNFKFDIKKQNREDLC